MLCLIHNICFFALDIFWARTDFQALHFVIKFLDDQDLFVRSSILFATTDKNDSGQPHGFSFSFTFVFCASAFLQSHRAWPSDPWYLSCPSHSVSCYWQNPVPSLCPVLLPRQPPCGFVYPRCRQMSLIVGDELSAWPQWKILLYVAFWFEHGGSLRFKNSNAFHVDVFSAAVGEIWLTV